MIALQVALWTVIVLDGVVVAAWGWDGYFGHTDAAGRGMARGFFALGAVVWLVLALPALLVPTWWVRGPALALLALPILLMLPIGGRRVFRRIFDSARDPVRGYGDPRIRRLLKAVKAGKVDRVREMAKGLPLAQRNRDGDTVAAFIAWGEFIPERVGTEARLEMLRAVLEAGAPATSVPWTMAVRGRPGMAEMLLEHGGDPAARTPDGYPEVHDAADIGRFDLVNKFLDRGLDPGIADADGRTLAMAVAKPKGTCPTDWALLLRLLEAGADVRAVAKFWDPLPVLVENAIRRAEEEKRPLPPEAAKVLKRVRR